MLEFNHHNLTLLSFWIVAEMLTEYVLVLAALCGIAVYERKTMIQLCSLLF